jgi:hypothetical protein
LGLGVWSGVVDSVESMFDGSLPEIADLAGLTDAELVDAAGGWVRAENAACARKMAVMAEIFARRTGLAAGERELWWVDPQAAVASELAAALDVSHGIALQQTHRGVALRDRLPKVAALFEQGVISELLVRVIVWRTYLIVDDEAMAAVDEALAARVTRWGPLSGPKTEMAIDALVEKYDRAALRHSRQTASAPTVEFGSPTDAAGTTSMWARFYAADAALLEARVEELAHSVCADDPRTMDERRAAALIALGAGTVLGCACGQSDCPAGSSGAAPAKNTLVYVVADQTSVDAARSDIDPTDSPTDLTTPTQPAPPPAYVFGGGIVPEALLGPIVQRATMRAITHPGQSGAEPRYRPSRALGEFVRCRDLTCRFPGCDKPAQVCDIDHTVPFPAGPTHPSNVKCLCRFHHLLKTFWTGVKGWRDRQLPDGTIIWTSPTGHTYTTYPGSLHLFPALCEPTATLWTGDPPVMQPTDQRGAMMPKRRHTRDHNTAKAIAAERRLNELEPHPHQVWLAPPPPDDDRPPPF